MAAAPAIDTRTRDPSLWVNVRKGSRVCLIQALRSKREALHPLTKLRVISPRKRRKCAVLLDGFGSMCGKQPASLLRAGFSTLQRNGAHPGLNCAHLP